MGAQATLTPSRLPVAPGGEATAEITVMNSGRVVDAFSLRGLGPMAEWLVCDPPVISLLPGQQGTARVVISPPVDSGLPHGPVPFAVQVVSREDPPGSVVEEGVLDVGGVTRVAADLSPRTGRARGMRASRHRIAVDNYGNAPALVTLVGSDDADTADVQVKPPQLEVAPGASGLADVSVRARRRFWRGPQATHRFQVSVLPPDGDPIRNDGSLLQEAVLPGWLPRAITLAVFGVLALTALWFALLRPVVQNTATSAGTAAGQRTAQRVVQSLLPDGGAGGGSSSPTASTNKPTQRKAPPTPVPFAQTLSRPAPTLTAPSGHSLAITDLVFQNPAGDTGMLNLSLSGQVLFSQALANFRDYDLHFLTPINVAQGQTLSLSVTCQNPPGGHPCTSSVFVSGTTRTS